MYLPGNFWKKWDRKMINNNRYTAENIEDKCGLQESHSAVESQEIQLYYMLFSTLYDSISSKHYAFDSLEELSVLRTQCLFIGADC